MDLRQIGGGRFFLCFNHIVDRNQALEGCPWSFEKNIIILSGVRENKNPLQVDLDWCDFYVHVHELPLSMMNLGVATLIGNRIGRFRDMDMDETGCTWGATLRLRVAFNVTHPLSRAILISSTLGDELLLHLTYERLPKFCYLCGKLGHISKYYEPRKRREPRAESNWWNRGEAHRESQEQNLIHLRRLLRLKTGGVDGIGGETHREGVHAASAKSFSPGQPFRQARAVGSDGRMQGTKVEGDLGSDDSLMDCAGMDSGVQAIPKDVEGHANARELGTVVSTEFVPSTILETSSVGGSLLPGTGKDKPEDSLVTVPLRFTARGPPGRRGTGRCGRPHGYGPSSSRKRPWGCSVLGLEGEVLRGGKRRIPLDI
ncbi:hypothetical protein Salat_1697700 [Sesamum alatum]|uniref:Zinc knuckle CX2CX4HX4C domain-containing protein n=1 Tax=Sesamum alatum TaxID=300844 RepID=A0AAE1Y8A3_9LAMI|nr:hypothetical protein Salat_1697700 [Sesamum alatum]